MVVPLQRWLVAAGADVRFGTRVVDAGFAADGGTRRATALYLLTDRGPETISLGPDDLALFTLGSITADATYGGMDDVPALIRDRADRGWSLWERIAAKQPDFGRPMTFYGSIDEHKWESFTLTMHDRVLLDRIVGCTGNQPGHVAFTVEYSVHGAMDAVYTLLGVDRPIPPICRGILDPPTARKALETTLSGKTGAA